MMSTGSPKENVRPFLQQDPSPSSSPLAPPSRFQDEIKMSRMKMWYTHPNPPFPSASMPLLQSSGHLAPSTFCLTLDPRPTQPQHANSRCYPISHLDLSSLPSRGIHPRVTVNPPIMPRSI